MMKNFTAAILVLALAAVTAPAARAQLDSSTVIEARSAILGADRTAAQIRALHIVPNIGVFRLDSGFASPFSKRGGEVNALQIFAEQNQTAIRQLRRALAANPVTRSTLSQNGVAINHVVGVNIGASGSLRVFVD